MSPSSSMAACLVTPPPASRRVAVIGAGAAGFVAARELLREGHSAVVFERGAAIGGTWVYTAATESDPQGLDPFREIVHSSLYDSLRTNLPRECMGFLDYPFSSGCSRAGGDPRRFPGHREVLRYLEDFCRDFDLYRLIRFQTEVAAVEKVCDGRWEVRSRRDGLVEESEVFDGVVVCNGHYTEPRVAEIPGILLVVCTQINSIKFSFENRQRLQSSHCIQPLNHYGGIDTWPGKQMHSHNYRVPEPFLDQMVVIIGSSSSAVDISRDIAKYAKEVHVSSRSPSTEFPKKQPGYDNMWLHSTIESTHKDGSVVFLDGSQFHVDVIIHCTGYKYHFPFLKTNNIVTVDDNCVGPLYNHVFPPSHAPSLSFIGIPSKVVPFPLFELQSKWVSGALSGRITLPTEEEMMADVEAWYLEIEAFGWPKRYSHNLSKNQFEYDDWLAAQCGHPPIEEWRKLMYESTSMNKIAQPEKYRDEWDDDHLVTQAEQSFKFL